jgi:hypothetical protein
LPWAADSPCPKPDGRDHQVRVAELLCVHRLSLLSVTGHPLRACLPVNRRTEHCKGGSASAENTSPARTDGKQSPKAQRSGGKSRDYMANALRSRRGDRST